MAKIVSVGFDKIPTEINIGDSLSDFTVITKIDFHELDLTQNMAYCLQLYAYDVRGSLDTPVVISNWDESHIETVSKDRTDFLLGRASELLTAKQKHLEVQTSMTLKLGVFNPGSSSHTRKLEVFATLIPAIERASAWSEPFVTTILH